MNNLITSAKNLSKMLSEKPKHQVKFGKKKKMFLLAWLEKELYPSNLFALITMSFIKIIRLMKAT
jgi:hypothetical protein